MEKHSKTKKRIEKRKRRSSGSDHEVTVKISKTNKKQKAKLRKPHLSSSSSSSSSTSSSNSSSSISSSSSSNNTSSSSDSSESEENHHRQHAEKKRVKKLKQKVQKKAKQRSKHEPVLEEEPSTDIPLDLMEKPKAMAPMTKEEWEKRQSVVRRVYDESTGRNRLIKGDGEVIEEIVSKERHKAINQQATKGDGNFFQTTLSSSLKK